MLAVCLLSSLGDAPFCTDVKIAWGDADALAEAGFCYAQGVGCKKDLKKSAKYYRMAESKGISMVGNSWCVSFSLVLPKTCLIIDLGSTSPNITTIPMTRERTPPSLFGNRPGKKASRGTNLAREICLEG